MGIYENISKKANKRAAGVNAGSSDFVNPMYSNIVKKINERQYSSNLTDITLPKPTAPLASTSPAISAPKPDKSAIQAQNYNRLMNLAAESGFAAKAAQRARAGELASGRDFVMGSAPSSFGTERVDYGVKSIGQTGIGAVPMVAATAKQTAENAAAAANSKEYAANRARLFMLQNGLSDIPEYDKRKEQEAAIKEQLNTVIQNEELNKAVDKNTFGMKMLRGAKESQERAVAGLNPTEQFVANPLISVGQYAAMLPTALINPAAPLVGMSTIASADKMYELSERGIGAGEAFTRGVVSGAIEAATEKIPLDNMLTMLKSSSGREVIKNILRQMGTEAGEEAVSYIANYVADKAANDPQASFSPSELAQAAAAGAISGGIMGGAGTAIGTLRNGGAEKIYALTEQKLQENAPQAETPVENTVNSQTIGNLESVSEQQEQPLTQEERLAKGMRSGLVPSKSADKVNVRTRRALSNAANRLGVKITFDDTLNGENGRYNPRTGVIHIALDSADPIGVIATHKMTHRMKETSPELYENFKNIAFGIMQENGSFENVRNAVIESYGENAAIDDDEILAHYTRNIVEDIGEFEKLVGVNRNLAQRIFDFFDQLIRKAGWDNNAQVALDNLFGDIGIGKLQRSREAWRVMLDKADAQARISGAEQQSIQYDVNSKPFVVIDSDILAGVPKKDWVKTVKETFKRKFPNGIDMGNFTVKQNADSRNEFTNSKYTQHLRDREKGIYADKMRMANNLDEIVQSAYNVHNEDLKHPRKDNYKSFNHGEIQIRIGMNDYTVDVVTAINTQNGEVFYDIVGIKPTKIEATPRGVSLISGAAPINSKAQTAPTVNTQNMPNGGEVMQSKPLPEPLMDTVYRLAEQGHNDFTRGGVEVAQGEKTGAYIQRKMREYGVSNENDLVAHMSAEDYAAYNERLAEEAAADDEARIESLMYDMDQQEMTRRLRAAAQAPKNTAEMLTDIDSGIIANDNINDDYKLLANVHFAGNKTLRENLDAAVKGAKGDLPLSEKERFRLRQWLYETFEKPLAESKAKYTKNIKIKAEGFAADMKRLGIKAGSKESAAVQWIGEGQIQDPDGEITEYTLDDLKRDFPQNWQKINEAAQICRRIYDNYVNEINDALKLVYPNVEAKAAETLAGFNNRAAQYNANANVWEQTAGELTEQAQQLMRDSQYMIGMEKARLVTQAQQLEQEAQKVLNRSQWYRKMADNSDQKAAELGRQIELGEILRNKRLMPRKDYFHHFNEMEQGLGGFINIISGSHDISPQLVGKSDFTKPKSKWWGALQHRAGGKYTADAVSGMAKYIPAAEYKIAFDPYIAKMRGNIEAMVRSTEKTKNANSLIEFLTDWTNDLAGKTNPYDRSLQKALGRKPMKALEWLNNRAKANAVMGNLGSALVQIGNIPNAMMLVKGPAHWLKAANDLFTFNGKDGQSVFLAERYINNTLDQLQNRSIITKGADGMMELGDRWAARLIWNAAYNQFESGFAKTNRKYESAVEYADDITRRAIGGRGIGELPLTQKARVVKLFAPFQVEVNNTFNLLAEQIGEKNALGLLNFALGSWLINSILFWMTGRRPLFDPIDAIKDAIMGFMDEDEEKKRTTLEKGADAVKRLGGEVIANTPYAATAATFLVGKENSEKIFGENDPTRYGTGNIAIQSIAEPVGQFLDGQNVDLIAPLTTFIPAYGGKQIERGIKGAQALGYLPRIEANVKNEKLLNVETNPFGMSRSASGRIRFPITSPADQIKTIALGEWSTSRAKDYLAEGMQPLSDPATEAMIEAFASGITPDDFYDAYRAMQKAKSDKDEKGETIRGSKKENQKELVRLAVPHLTTAQRMKLYVALGIEKEDKKK